MDGGTYGHLLAGNSKDQNKSGVVPSQISAMPFVSFVVSKIHFSTNSIIHKYN